MNQSLEIYKDDKIVWEIGGYVYPVEFANDKEYFFSPYTTSWGWATWADRWNYFERNPKKLIRSMTKHDITKFNLDINSGLIKNSLNPGFSILG